jgi:FAD/FMN-containing dehydrogenase
MDPLKEITFLSAEQIKTDSAATLSYGKDWTTYFDIKASAILFPRSTHEVVQIVHWARKNKLSLIPSGGRTGLSGGACAVANEVVVSFEQMTEIKDFNPVEQTVNCQAGVITENLQKFAVSKNLFYPIDFAARGSSQIGGNIATNAGGIKVVRYGLTRDWVANLTVVTGTGEVLELGKSLVKNATGYDLKHLLIGSEGTLGFITEATLRLTSAPADVQVLVLAVPSLDQVMESFALFKAQTNLIAFEMFSEKALAYVLKSTGLPRPFPEASPFYLVVEVEKRSSEDEAQILDVFEKALEQGWITDGSMSQSEEQIRSFWRYREDISESLSTHSPYKNDIAVPISKVPGFIKDLDQILGSAYPSWEVVWFGHIGDGNLHINILRPPGLSKEAFVKECQKVDNLVFSTVQKYHGSISAEHGVGLTKKSFLSYSRSPIEIEIMKGIKKIFDPDGILNPGKLLD